MFCDGLGRFGRTTGKQPRDLPSHLSDEIAIILGTSLRIALSTQSARFAVRQAFRFGLFERHFRNQNALTFVSLARAAETDDYRGEWAVHPRSARSPRNPWMNCRIVPALVSMTDSMINFPAAPALRRKATQNLLHRGTPLSLQKIPRYGAR